MKIGSLFSGAGGLDMAVEAVFGGSTVWHCELDPAASKVLAHRWPGVPNLGDITTVDWTAVEPIDVLCGGFPCQDVSAAGKRAGIREGTRSGLWALFAEAIDQLKPRYVVVENVRGLLSARAHRAMESAETTMGDNDSEPVLRAIGAVLGDLSDLGYNAQWTTVAAADVGAPHRRERVFILATDTDQPRPQRGQSARRHELSARRDHSDVELLPTPSAADGLGGHLSRSGDRIGELLLSGIARAHARGELLPTPAASRSGRNRSVSDGAAIRPSLDMITDLLPTPAAADGERGPDFARANREGSGGDDLVTLCAKATRDTNWGKYEAAIHRWEALTRSAPLPTEPNSRGNPRLAAVFPEWMQGWPAGWVTALVALGLISRNDALRIIGNGVVPQQATAALRWLIQIAEVAA